MGRVEKAKAKTMNTEWESLIKKVLFLDIDGVLNNGQWASGMHEQGVDVYKEHLLEERALALLQRIIYGSGTDIVVTSSWRHDAAAYQKLLEQLSRYRMKPHSTLQGPGTDRGQEIHQWLSEHPGIEAFVILDDDDDVGEYREQLIKTNPDRGLTSRDVSRCLHLLNKSSDSMPEDFIRELEKRGGDYYVETAIYVRTVDKKGKEAEKGSWRLPEGISAEVEIGRLCSYAYNHGYENPVIYLDNGYAGSGTSDPANILLHRKVMEGNVGAVIINAPHQIEGGMNILIMTEKTFREHGVKLIIASHDQEAWRVINQNYDAWMWEEIEESEQSLGEGKGLSIEEATRHLWEEMDQHQREYEQDLENAKPVPPKYTRVGYRIIDATEALWLLKTEYGSSQA